MLSQNVWNVWQCGVCGGNGFIPEGVNDSYLWMVEHHGYDRCAPRPGFIDGGGI